MRLFVTGGAGFIGSAFVREAVRRGHAVLNIDMLTYAGDVRTCAEVRGHEMHQFVQANIADGPAMHRLFAEFRPEAVLNLAAESHVDRSIDGPAVFLNTNVLGTFTLLHVATDYWSALHIHERERFRFVQVSTDEVFGSLGSHGRFSEASRYAPNSPYSASKAAGDLLARAWSSTFGLPTIVSNCSNNYGPYQHPEKLIPTVLRSALAGEPITIYGNGENRRDWLYVDDHVDGLFRLLEQGLPGKSYIFGSGVDVANIELAGMICDILDARRPRAHGSHRDLLTLVADRPGHDYRYAVDPSKASTALGWCARIPLAAGIAATIKWYLAHPDWLTRNQQEYGRLGLAGARSGP